MFEDQDEKLHDFDARLKELRKCLNVTDTRIQISALEDSTANPEFWNDPEAAQKVMQEMKVLKDAIEEPDKLAKDLEDAQVLVELAMEAGEASMQEEVEASTAAIEKRLKQLEMTSLFSDPRDMKPAILNIHPGAGGTESCDWAEILYRMLTRWCERRKLSVDVVDYQPGEEAGLKSATMTVEGLNAYGLLKSESGVHRLVRISPYDANKRRHTSFAAVEVMSQIDESINVDLREEDIKMDVFRASGPGGQKVNKTSSAVRLTHTPSGIVVACQIERSQHRNREVAMDLLRSKLYDIEIRKQQAEIDAQREGQMDVAWGSQIRSYVLAPYQLIKDHRTDVETGSVDRVLDGELDDFVEGYLKWNLELRSRN